MLKYITIPPIPHVSTIKKRWVRRIVIVIGFPSELVRALCSTVYHLVMGSIFWWRQP